MFGATFADQIANKCCEKYQQLPSTGKPQKKREWTHLAAVVKCIGNSENNLEVVSLGTGSKCIGQSKMSEKGDVLNDSHAEVIARRAFLRYIYHQIHLALEDNSTVVTYVPEERSFRLRNDISFHLFISHTPCGDASIFPKETGPHLDDIGQPVDTDTVIQSNTEDNIWNCVKDDASNVLLSEFEKKCSDFSGDCDRGQVSSEKLSVNPELSSMQNLADVTRCAKRKVECVHNYLETQRLKCNTTANIISTKKFKADSTDVAETILLTSASTNMSCQSPSGKGPTPLAADVSEKLFNSPKDVYRTGAKCVPDGKQDLLLPGNEYHVVGAVRTKPGRGDRTLSLSCSDKLAKWNVVGIQGAMLAQLISHPVYLSSIIIGNCPYSKEALHRAIVGRVVLKQQLPFSYKQNEPFLLKTSIEFEGSRQSVSSTSSGNVTPCSSAIVWSNVPSQPLEVAVNGRKQGITKKHLKSPKARCLISKKELLICFKNLLAELCERQLFLDLVSNSRNLPYLDIKRASSSYQQALEVFRKGIQVRPTKPAHLEQFDDKS